MLNVPEKVRTPLNRQSILTLNQIRVQTPLSSQHIQDINIPASVKTREFKIRKFHLALPSIRFLL